MVKALMPIIIKTIWVLCTETNERLIEMEVRFLTNITEYQLLNKIFNEVIYSQLNKTIQI